MKPTFYLLVLLWLTSHLSTQAQSCTVTTTQVGYDFCGKPTDAVLQSYLHRAITMQGVCGDEYPLSAVPNQRSQDITDLQEMQAKFIGRAGGWWANIGSSSLDNAQFSRFSSNAAAIHANDDHAIIQAGLFEIINYVGQTPPADGIDVPQWVWNAWHDSITDPLPTNPVRRFKSQDIGHTTTTGSFVIVDVTKLEARMWLYYRACSYIAAGAEALHMGQWSLISDQDHSAINSTVPADYYWSNILFRTIRRYADVHARRGYVLLDCHTANRQSFTYNGFDLFDFYSTPSFASGIRSQVAAMSPNGTCTTTVQGTHSFYPGFVNGAELQVNTCNTLDSPAPFQAHGPRMFLVELDNGGIENCSPNMHYMDRWGWDDITWFDKQPRAYGADWLRYASNWLQCNDPNLALEMPGRRDSWANPQHEPYQFNVPSGNPLKKRITDIWDGETTGYEPIHLVPNMLRDGIPQAITTSNIAIQFDGSLAFASFDNGLLFSQWDHYAATPSWTSSYVASSVDVGNTPLSPPSDVAGDVCAPTEGSFYYRTLAGGIAYYKYRNASGDFIRRDIPLSSSDNVSGNIVFETRYVNELLQSKTANLFYRGSDGYLRFVEYNASTDTWTTSSVTPVNNSTTSYTVDNAENSVFSICEGVVVYVCNGQLKVFRRIGNTWTDVTPTSLGSSPGIAGNLSISYANFQPLPSNNSLIIASIFCRQNDGSLYNAWVDINPSNVSVRSTPVSVPTTDASGDVIATNPSHIIYQTGNTLSEAFWGCPNGSGTAMDWFIQRYSTVRDCAGKVTRQLDGTLYYKSTAGELKYVTWEAFGCNNGRFNCPYCATSAKVAPTNKSVSKHTQAMPQAGLQVFPNPGATSVTLSLTRPAQEVVHFQLLDLAGRIVAEFSTTSEATQADIQDLPNGVYLVRAQTATGVSTTRITVQH